MTGTATALAAATFAIELHTEMQCVIATRTVVVKSHYMDGVSVRFLENYRPEDAQPGQEDRRYEDDSVAVYYRRRVILGEPIETLRVIDRKAGREYTLCDGKLHVRPARTQPEPPDLTDAEIE